MLHLSYTKTDKTIRKNACERTTIIQTRKVKLQEAFFSLHLTNKIIISHTHTHTGMATTTKKRKLVVWWAKNPRGHKNAIFTKQATAKAHPMSLPESSKQGLLKPSLEKSPTHLLAALYQKTTALWSLCFIIQIYASPSPNRYKPTSANNGEEVTWEVT